MLENNVLVLQSCVPLNKSISPFTTGQETTTIVSSGLSVVQLPHKINVHFIAYYICIPHSLNIHDSKTKLILYIYIESYKLQSLGKLDKFIGITKNVGFFYHMKQQHLIFTLITSFYI